MDIIYNNDIEISRFWSRVTAGSDGHWFFSGKKAVKRKNGIYSLGGKNMTAARAAWLITGHALEYRSVLEPTCGEIECINPQHMKNITRSEHSQKVIRAYRDKIGRLTPEEKRQKHNKNCRLYREKHLKEQRAYQAAYHKVWHHKNKK